MEIEEVPSPFDRRNAMINTAFVFMPTVIALYAISKYKPRKLPLFITANAAFYTVMRRFGCARCQYYGKECSTMSGIMTARMMPRDESKPLDRNALIADMAIMSALGLYAMPQIFRSYKLAALYHASLIGSLSAHLFNACGKCGNDFCPMKDLRKAIIGTEK